MLWSLTVRVDDRGSELAYTTDADREPDFDEVIAVLRRLIIQLQRERHAQAAAALGLPE